MMGDANPRILSSFVSESGATVFGVIKSRRLHVRATLDGKKCQLPPMTAKDAEKLGTMQAKFMEWSRATEAAEALL